LVVPTFASPVFVYWGIDRNTPYIWRIICSGPTNGRTQLNEQILSKITEKRIFMIRGQRVMIDSDLADLYQVKTKELNKSMKRNSERFPTEFMFQITPEEFESLRFQIGTSKIEGRGGRRTPPFVFTEQGVAMLSSILKSSLAIQVNIVIIKTFVRLRQIVGNNQEILKRLGDLEKESSHHKLRINEVFQTIRQLLEPAVKPRRPMGIRGPDTDDEKVRSENG